jgi:hypothetical protein
VTKFGAYCGDDELPEEAHRNLEYLSRLEERRDALLLENANLRVKIKALEDELKR